MDLRYVVGAAVGCVLLAGSSVAADDCWPYLDRQAEVDVTVPGVGRIYVDSECIPICLEGFLEIVVYEESNGIDRLQRWDATADDTCDGLIPPDTLIF